MIVKRPARVIQNFTMVSAVIVIVHRATANVPAMALRIALVTVARQEAINLYVAGNMAGPGRHNVGWITLILQRHMMVNVRMNVKIVPLTRPLLLYVQQIIKPMQMSALPNAMDKQNKATVSARNAKLCVEHPTILRTHPNRSAVKTGLRIQHPVSLRIVQMLPIRRAVVSDNNCHYDKYCSKAVNNSVSLFYYKGFKGICVRNLLIVNNWHEICTINKRDVGFL